MRTTVFILLANAAALALIAVLAARGVLPLAPAAVADRGVFGDLSGIAGGRRIAADPARVAVGSRAVPSTSRWTAPLLERTLTAGERAEGLAPDLQDAIMRMEPIYDPTRLDPWTATAMRVWAGAASLFDVFGERWRLASDDPNVNARSLTVGLAWQASGPRTCEGFTKRRAHEFGEAALTAMTETDCARQRRWLRDDVAPLPVVAAPLDLPAFAAPLPGARMTSEAFWAAQEARMLSIRAHLQRKWQGSRPPVEIGSNR